MTDWLKLSDSDRLISLQQANARSGISMKAIEKDWWVTLILKVVFATKYANYLQFKGGTSLNKCWGLIQRFSEDVDLSIERDFLGFPEVISKSQVKRLKKAAAEFTSTDFKEEVESQIIKIGVPEGMVIIVADPIPEIMPDIDPQTIRINYPSLLDTVPYIADSVKIEVSARSLKEPGVERPINSMLGEYMSGLPWSGTPFNVSSVQPKRTFLEKIFLLHEEFLKPVSKINFHRMSRHIYDIERMIDTEYAIEALSNLEYYNSIVLHRRKFIFKSGVDYDTLYPKRISFLPPKEVHDDYENDYNQMKEQMIYGEEIRGFERLINRLTNLQNRVRKLSN